MHTLSPTRRTRAIVPVCAALTLFAACNDRSETGAVDTAVATGQLPAPSAATTDLSGHLTRARSTTPAAAR